MIRSGQNALAEFDAAVGLGAARLIELFVDGARGQARIEVRRERDGIELRLHGHGLDDLSRGSSVAMRERAALLGATIDPDPTTDGPGQRVFLAAQPITTLATQASSPGAVENSRRLKNLPWPALLAAADFILLQAQVQASLPVHGPRLLNGLAVLGVTAPLSWCRRWPLLAAATGLSAMTVMSATLAPAGAMAGGVLLWLVLPFAVAAFSNGPRAILGFGICASFMLFSGWLGLPGTRTLVAAAGLLCTFVLAAWVAGLVVRDRSRLARNLQQVNERLVEERDATARQVVAEERARVARELHDVIGHSLTVIVLQAGAARRVWETDRARALASLSALGQVLKGGLTDLLSSLDFIEARGRGAGSTTSEQLEEMMAGMAKLAGVQLQVRVEGAAPALSPDAERASYRVLQEALTNAIKHAPGCPLTLDIRYGPKQVELEVSNELPAVVSVEPTETGGRGLAGMRRRVEACGGMLEWDRRQDAFSLRARLPVRT